MRKEIVLQLLQKEHAFLAIVGSAIVKDLKCNHCHRIYAVVVQQKNSKIAIDKEYCLCAKCTFELLGKEGAKVE